MKSQPVGSGQSILAVQINALRDDTRGGALLLAHQQLGALALPNNPTNGQTVTIVVNGNSIVKTWVTSLGTTADTLLIQSTPAWNALVLYNALIRPDVTNTLQVASASANQVLLQYVGWALPAGSTTITPFPLNNAQNALLTSFSASSTVTGASWTANTMALYVEPGVYYVGTTQVKFLGGSTPTVVAPSSNPRIDLLTINSSGTLAWTTGTPASSPTPPSYPSGQVFICELYNVVGETALYDNANQQSGQGYIQADVRPFNSINASATMQTNGVNSSWTNASSSGTLTIAHSLGHLPMKVRITAYCNPNGGLISQSCGVYNGSATSCVYSNTVPGDSATYGVYLTDGSGNGQEEVITFDATNIYIAFTKLGSPFGSTIYLLWEAQ